MKGSYAGVPNDGAHLESHTVDYPNAKLDFTGYELSIGVIVSP